jgi:hypothetical protein
LNARINISSHRQFTKPFKLGGAFYRADSYGVVDEILGAIGNSNNTARSDAVIAGARIIFPDIARPTRARLGENHAQRETLRRIAQCLKMKLPEYRQINSFIQQYIEIVKPRVSSEHQDQLDATANVADAIAALSPEPTDSEEIHGVLKKVSAAASALLYFYQVEVTRLGKELKNLRGHNDSLTRKVAQLTRRRVIATESSGVDSIQLTLKLLKLKSDGVLPDFETIRGRGAPPPSVWIEGHLGKHFTKQELKRVCGDQAIWYQVDKKLHKTLNDRAYRQREREKNSTAN